MNIAITDTLDAIKKLKQLTTKKDAEFADAANYFYDITEQSSLITESKTLRSNLEYFKGVLTPAIYRHLSLSEKMCK